MTSNPQIARAHSAAEQAARGFGFTDYAELNQSNNEQAKAAARAAFDIALSDYAMEE
ncbi:MULTISPECIES: hypothetical protein [Shewanella]|uniref:hypothetical protein n=1 Tax=Shewanella TaxID=22 RepID=UPI00159404EA|nr:hypothetical protein KVP08_022885 [Shewanella putrefaciens]